MAITTAAKYDFDIPTHAKALKIPTNSLKLIIQKLFGMGAWRLIPDKISFIELIKLYVPSELAANITGPVLLNGEDTLIIAVRKGQGTDEATTLAYICKAAKTVYDLNPWASVMDASLK